MGPGKKNRLALAASTYLREHGDNPVDWHPWGQEAFAKAQAEGKPVFLSIGYATCHWCHVMARESFSDPEIARFLNEHFVAIKVDRQELPQVDEVYMRAALAMGSQGGWPLSVFCTPDGLPFFAGTYFPPKPRGGLPSFREVLERVVSFWQSQGQQLAKEKQALVSLLVPPAPAPGSVDVKALQVKALARLEADFDEENGGFGEAPKFPLPAQLAFLLHLARKGNAKAQHMLTKSLDGMAQGGIRDVLFGGFHRYATDERWFIPHYEKMLPDNALLAQLYLEAGRFLEVERFRRVGKETLAFLNSLYRVEESLLDWAAVPHPFFAAAWDAETRGVEGLTFTFTLEQLSLLLSGEELALVQKLSPFPWSGEPRPLALRPLDGSVAKALGLPWPDTRKNLARALAQLKRLAKNKGLPTVDVQAVSAWNAMAVWAFCHWLQKQKPGTALLPPVPGQKTHKEAPRALSPEWAASVDLALLRYAKKELLPLAAAEALWQLGWHQGHAVPRVLHKGVPVAPETLEDLAWAACAFLEIFLTTGASFWLKRALELVKSRVPLYRGTQGELCTTPEDASVFPIRQRNPFDGAHPSPGAVLCRTLYRLWWLTGDDTFRRWADEAVAAEAHFLSESPHNATSWLLAAEEGQKTSVLVVAGSPQWASTRALIRTAHGHPHKPDMVVFLDRWPASREELSWLPVFENRPAAGEEQARAYLCRGSECFPPVASTKDLQHLLTATFST